MEKNTLVEANFLVELIKCIGNKYTGEPVQSFSSSLFEKLLVLQFLPEDATAVNAFVKMRSSKSHLFAASVRTFLCIYRELIPWLPCTGEYHHGAGFGCEVQTDA